MNSSLAEFAQDSAATGVLRGLAEGRWRKARDLAKELCKKDRARYLPLLIEANVGLARELLGKGLPKDAETVVAYLKTIAPAEVVAALEKELAAPPVKIATGTAAPERTGSPEARFLAAWANVIKTAAGLEAGVPAESGDWAAVDLAVTCFQTPPSVETGSLTDKLKAELELVHEAIAATGEGRWEDAQKLLRGLERQSVFQHWRMFLRGVRHDFLREAEAARKCFATLPADGALARAARVIAGAEAVPGTTRLASSAARAGWWLAASGEKAALAAPVAEAHLAWTQGEWRRAYDLLSKAFGKEFPNSSPCLAGLLSDVMLPSYHPHSPMELKRDEQIHKASTQPAFIEKGGATMSRGFFRALVIRDAAEMNPADLKMEWTDFLGLEQKINGSSSVRDSIAWQWLGEQMMEEKRDLGLFETKRVIKSAVGAREALDKAVQCDPENESAYLALLKLYTVTEDKPARNKLLDDLVKRFPGNKEVQMQAGVLAAERKAFGKALTYLRAALALDPLDAGVKAALALALVGQARDLIKKKKPVEAVWQEMEPLLQDQPGGGSGAQVSRWSMRLRRSLLEGRADLLGEAQQMAPSQLQCLLLEQLLVQEYKLPLRATWIKDWQEALHGDAPGWRKLHEIMEMLDKAFENRLPWQTARALDSRFSAVAEKSVSAHLTADPGGTLDFVTFWLARKARRTDYGPIYHTITSAFQALTFPLQALVKKNRRKTDPRLRLALLMIEHANPLLPLGGNQYERAEEVIKDARAQDMPQVVEKATRLMKELAAEDGYFEDDDDDAFEEVDSDLPPLPEDLPPEIQIFLLELMTAIMNGDDAKIQEMKRLAASKGIPPEEFDQMVANLIASKPEGNPKKGKKAPHPELDLF